jgi:DNA-binding response OmpR family regulator
VRQALCDLGYRVLVADNVHVAMEIFEDNLASIDLLISDVVMPELNGYELASKMCLLKPQLPVLFVSGFSADIQPGPESERLNRHRISKPYTNAELSGAVRTALDSDG